jgi:hypothetical protein
MYIFVEESEKYIGGVTGECSHSKNSGLWLLNVSIQEICPLWLLKYPTRGSVGWSCVAHLSFCFEEI